MYRRNTHSNNPMSDYGHAMFVEIEKEDSIGSYGPVAWLYDGTDITPIETLREAIISTWDEYNDICLVPRTFEHLSGEDIYNACLPVDIVDSAGIYDDGDLVQWLWEHVFEERDIRAVSTPDGAIVFDETLIMSTENKEILAA